MTFRTFFEKHIRGWFPQEPKMPQTLLKGVSTPTSPYLRFSASLKIVYALTLGVVAAWLIGYFVMCCWQDSSRSILSNYLFVLPSMFFLNLLPLAIFSIVFLTKGGGTNYFRSWKAGKKLQVAGYAILTGYITVMLPQLLNVSGFIHLEFNNHQPYFETVSNISNGFIAVGLVLMFFGFGYLVLLHKRSVAFKDEPITPDQTTRSKKKTTKKIVALVFVIAILSVSFACLAGIHYNLQKEYDTLSEGFEHMRTFNVRLVDEQWTDNPGNTSKYVNYKVGVLNIGYTNSNNVTVIVLVHGLDNTLLTREEIFVGDLNVMQYEKVDVNINYSGEFSHITSGYRVD